MRKRQVEKFGGWVSHQSAATQRSAHDVIPLCVSAQLCHSLLSIYWDRIPHYKLYAIPNSAQCAPWSPPSAHRRRAGSGGIASQSIEPAIPAQTIAHAQPSAARVRFCENRLKFPPLRAQRSRRAAPLQSLSAQWLFAGIAGGPVEVTSRGQLAEPEPVPGHRRHAGISRSIPSQTAEVLLEFNSTK